MSKWYIALALVAGGILGFLLTMRSLAIFSILITAAGIIACFTKDSSGGFFASSRAVALYYVIFYILLPFLFASWVISIAIYVELFMGISVFHLLTHSIFR
ncbi:MAG: hypothetical protein Q8O83_00985 [bacterium]|nr:hypothetical protein [bacterium]